MEDFLKSELNFEYVKPTNYSGGGCINNGKSYDTNKGRFFLKYNKKQGSHTMFKGEFLSLEAIEKTNSIKVPHPVSVFEKTPCGSAILLEHFDLSSLKGKEAELGTKLAHMHKYNLDTKEITQFGFHDTTCCGFLPLDNSWKDDWISFYAQNRIKPQVEMLVKERGKSNVGDLNHLYELLVRKMPEFFTNIEVRPSLVHGDLWSGNVGATKSEAVIFDPGSFYAHSEFEFGIMTMFGGFSRTFYDAYFKVLPKQKGHDKRNSLYELFHNLNHWNHFGSSYKSGSMSILKGLTS